MIRQFRRANLITRDDSESEDGNCQDHFHIPHSGRGGPAFILAPWLAETWRNSPRGCSYMKACSLAIPSSPAKSSRAISLRQVLAERDQRTAKHAEGFRRWKE